MSSWLIDPLPPWNDLLSLRWCSLLWNQRVLTEPLQRPSDACQRATSSFAHFVQSAFSVLTFTKRWWDGVSMCPCPVSLSSSLLKMFYWDIIHMPQQFTHSEYTFRWLSKFPFTTIHCKTFLLLWKETPYPLAATAHFPPSPEP